MTQTHANAPAGDKRLTPPRLKLAEFVRSPYRVAPEAGTSIDEVMAPDYFAHVAQHFRPGDKLEIMPDCMSWYAEALVVDATKLSCRTTLLVGPVALDAGERVLASDAYEARWISPALRYGVRRKDDGAYVQKNLATKADAEQWIAGRVGLKAVATAAETGA